MPYPRKLHHRKFFIIYYYYGTILVLVSKMGSRVSFEGKKCRYFDLNSEVIRQLVGHTPISEILTGKTIRNVVPSILYFY